MSFRFLNNHKFTPFAHRGGSLENSENTLDAFEKCISIGYDYIETDVRETRDGKLVIFHDEDFSRICGLKVKVNNNTWGLLNEKEFDEAGREIFAKYYKFNGDPNYELTSEYDTNYQFRPLKVTRANYEDLSTLGSPFTYEETVWINKSATTTVYSNNGSGDILREEFITVNEFDDWLTYVTKSNNVVQQSITLTYKADRFKPYYTQ